MSEKAKKVYIKGGAKEFTFKNGGKVINFSVNVPQLNKILEWYNKKLKDSKAKETEYLPLVMQEKFNGEDDWGNTHNVTLNMWKIDNVQSDDNSKKPSSSSEDDDLPF